MENELLRPVILVAVALGLTIGLTSCKKTNEEQTELTVPNGYYATLEVTVDSRLYRFGPFVGYYFRPKDPADLSKLDFLCYNEQRFYTRDLPANVLLFSGDAILTSLPEPGTEYRTPAGKGRITPVFEDAIPPKWSATRPPSQTEYRHFHSVHDSQGAAMIGYWLRHVGENNFIYDMGGRVGPDSPLYHKVSPGVDLQFAFIVEFDHGPQKTVM